MSYSVVLIAIPVLIFFFVVLFYNKFVALRNYVREAFSTMDVYMKKRWDLIPNLVEIAKAYMEHEKGVFENIAKLRNINYSSLSNNQKMDVNAQISSGLSSLFAVAENYPELKANETFTTLMAELTVVENDIADSRKYYNGCVRELNTAIELFPGVIIANIFNFKQEKMFEIDEVQRENIKVQF